MLSRGSTLTDLAVLQPDSNGQFRAFSFPSSRQMFSPCSLFDSVVWQLQSHDFEVVANAEREAAGSFPPFLALWGPFFSIREVLE